ncbi:MAG: hypothetical protein RL595_545 [Planctomycetota bacterium]|jgi:uncharacterized FAD-dependent dehydrogenase
MALRVSNITLRVEEPETLLPGKIAKALSVAVGDISAWRILRKSLDARDKQSLLFVYSMEVQVSEEQSVFKQAARRRFHSQPVELYSEAPFEIPPIGNFPLKHRPIVIGSGPAGLAAAYFLAERGFRPLLLERGKKVRDRIHDVKAFDEGGPFEPDSNYLFGEGGAGTFSDGKLTYRGSGPDVKRILQLFADNKGKPSILYDYRPHLGSNRLPAVVKSLRKNIQALGGEVVFNCKVEDFDIRDNSIQGVYTSSGFFPADCVILAIGHSARDTYQALHAKNILLEQKPFQMGVRIEQPQETANRVKYGPAKLENVIGAADYSLVANGKYDLFTFCMCAGGYIMPSVSEPEAFCTNGMSLSKHDSPYANSGLVITIPTAEFGSTHPLAGMHFQEKYERAAFELSRTEYRCPIQRATDFLDNRTSSGSIPSSYPRGLLPTDLHAILPGQVIEALHQGLPIMDRKWRGRFLEEATLVGPEGRGSAPVRIVRDNTTRESPSAKGLFPVGEGAGYAGGIVSAALDGLRTSMQIISCHAPAN